MLPTLTTALVAAVVWSLVALGTVLPVAASPVDQIAPTEDAAAADGPGDDDAAAWQTALLASEGFRVLQRQEADVTGDGVPEAIVLAIRDGCGSCHAQRLIVFSGQAVLADMWLDDPQVSPLLGEGFEVKQPVRLANEPYCCPSTFHTEQYTYDPGAGTFVVSTPPAEAPSGPPQPALAPRDCLALGHPEPLDVLSTAWQEYNGMAVRTVPPPSLLPPLTQFETQALLWSAGLYGNPPTDPSDAYLQHARRWASLRALFSSDETVQALGQLADRLDQVKTLEDAALPDNCGLVIIRATLRAKPLDTVEYLVAGSFLADEDRSALYDYSRGSFLARALGSGILNAGMNCKSPDLDAYPELLLKAVLSSMKSQGKGCGLEVP